LTFADSGFPQCLSAGYRIVAVALNELENHRTDTQYEDSLITKIFVFNMVNSFAGLTYLSFIKFFLNLTCSSTTCTGDVSAALSTIFITALVMRAITRIFLQKV
jgi:hypothetical protein